MEILLEPAGLPDRGTVIVPVGHDGTLGTVAAELDAATDGLVRRALAAVPNLELESDHERNLFIARIPRRK